MFVAAMDVPILQNRPTVNYPYTARLVSYAFIVDIKEGGMIQYQTTLQYLCIYFGNTSISLTMDSKIEARTSTVHILNMHDIATSSSLTPRSPDIPQQQIAGDVW